MEIYKTYKNESQVSKLAKQAAIISEFSIKNPLHVAFEDGNLTPYDNMEFEKITNEYYINENGAKMYQYIKNFLELFVLLSAEEQRKCFRLYHKKYEYLSNKINRRLNVKHTNGFAYRHYLKDGKIVLEDSEGNIAYTF